MDFFSVKCVHYQSCCLSYFSTEVTEHNDYGNLEEIKFIGLTVLEGKFTHDHHCMEHGSRQAGTVLEQ